MLAYAVSHAAGVFFGEECPTKPAVIHFITQERVHDSSAQRVARSVDELSKQRRAERLGDARQRDQLVQHRLSSLDAERCDAPHVRLLLRSRHTAEVADQLS